MAVIIIVSIQHWIHYDNAATRAANDARQTQDQITSECVGLNGPAPKCAREVEQASRSEQRDEYDLYSQQAMALWTSVMGAMAVLGVALSGLGVYLIWRTWDATREAAETSQKTYKAFISVEAGVMRAKVTTPFRIRDRESHANKVVFSMEFLFKGKEAAGAEGVQCFFGHGKQIEFPPPTERNMRKNFELDAREYIGSEFYVYGVCEYLTAVSPLPRRTYIAAKMVPISIEHRFNVLFRNRPHRERRFTHEVRPILPPEIPEDI